MISFREPELLDSLVPSILKCAEHRHSYVRKYASLAIAAVYQCNQDLIPDAISMLAQMFLAEQNPSAKRNCFLALQQIDVRTALDSLTLPLLNQGGEHLQLAVLGSIRSLMLQYQAQYGQSVEATDSDLYDRLETLTAALLQLSSSQAIQFEAANTVLQLFVSNEELVKASIAMYCSLLRLSSESSVRHLCLSRLHQLLDRYRPELQANLLEILHFFPIKGGASLSSSLAKFALDLLVQLVSTTNADQIVQHLILCMQHCTADQPLHQELIQCLQRMHHLFFQQLTRQQNETTRSLCSKISSALLPLISS